MLDITLPHVIKFYNENFQKETTLRVRWFQKNHEKLHKSATLDRECSGYTQADLQLIRNRGELDSFVLSFEGEKRNRRREMGRVNREDLLREKPKQVGIDPEDFKNVPERADLLRAIETLRPMYPVPPETRCIVYRDKPTFGRVAYLNKRSRVIPEKRYYFPECSSWEYGWRCGAERGADGTYRRRAVMRESIIMRTAGSRPDPPHYFEPASGQAPRCIAY